MTDANITALEDRLATLPDAELLREYLATDGEVGDPMADILADEIERRGLDV